jgi:hypothetical protein
MIAHQIVAFLISLAVGYWLLTLADKQNGLVKTLGQVFAGIIIVVSLLGPLGVAASAFCRHGHGGYWQRHGNDACCMMDGKSSMMKGDCPMDMKGKMMKGHDGPGGMGLMGKEKEAAEEKEDSK